MNAPGAADNQAAQDLTSRLGIKPDMIVQEIGWDDDCDATISEAIEDVIGEELLDEETDELCDVVLLWYREDDGDLVDILVDAGRNLSGSGRIWLLTPGVGKPGGMPAGEINEAAQLAGMVHTTSERFGGFQGTSLVNAGAKR